MSRTFKYDNAESRYGDIHSVSLFGHPVIVLSSLNAIEEFRAASPDNFTHRCLQDLKKKDVQMVGCVGRDSI